MTRGLNIFVPHCSDLLTDHLPHGDGLVAHGFISGLAERGHRLHVAVERVDLREPLSANVTLHQIHRSRTGLLGRLIYMIQVRRLFQSLKKTVKFDLIHQFNPVFTGMSLALYGCQLPLVLGTYVARWLDDPDALSSRSRRSSALISRGRDVIARLQQSKADTLLLTTPAAWNRLPNPETVKDRIQILPHGIDTKTFSPSDNRDSIERLEAGQNSPSILFFANVFKRKGIFTLIDSFPAVAGKIPTVRLRIAGDGPELAGVKRLVANLECRKQVDFLGRQERSAAPELYRNCTVYCLPSFGEPYGATIIEAMSCAKPVVTTDTGAPPHLVHKKGGRCVPAGDSVALADALIELLSNPPLCSAMGRHNRSVVESTMSWDSVIRRLEEIYEWTLAKSPTAKHWDRKLQDVDVSEPAAGSEKSVLEVA